MPTTPVIPHGVFRLHYTAAGFTHILNVRHEFRGTPTPGARPTIAAKSGAGADRDSDDFGTYLWSKISPQYLSADHFDNYEVFLVTTSPPTFIYSSTAGLPGTHSGGSAQRAENQKVVTFRDGAAKKVKFNFFATADGFIGKVTTVGTASMSVFITDCLPSAGVGSLQDYITGRSGEQLLTFMSQVGGANNALERRIVFP